MWLGLLLVFFYPVNTLRLDRCNASALGMESGVISDSQITASSSFDRQSVGPQNGRIRTELSSGAWCPKNQIHSNSYEFIQVTLNRSYVITSIETQGRFGNGTGREYATNYMIDYLRNGSQWIRYRNRTGHQLMTGNHDTATAVMRELDPPIVASRIRLVPASKQTRTMCMRIELYGCPNYDGVMFYSMEPQGSRIGFLDFRDRTFEQSDLFDENGSRRGLGLLYDGVVSDKSPYLDTPENGTWIGWNREQSGGEVNMTIEFDTLRNFSSVEFAAFGEKMEAIDVIFSQDGSSFPLVSQISSLDQSSNRTMRRFDLRLPLHRRTARIVRMSIRFATEWFFLTEINFNSGITDRPTEYTNLPSVLFNHSAAIIEKDMPTAEPEVAVMDYTLFYYTGFAIVTCVLVFFICLLFCLRRRPPLEKKNNIYDGENRAAMIVTTMGSNKINVYPTHQYMNQLNGGMYSSDKTVSTSLSSKSNCSNKTNPPTWNDFHFPPPPDASEGGYAEPCMTLPLLPSQQRLQTNTQQNSRTLNRSPKKHKIQQELVLLPEYVDDTLHYATSNIFTTYGFENVKKLHHNNLSIGADLGEGKFTLVRECRSKEISKAAHKCSKERGNIHARRALLDELRVLSSCSHPHIVKLFGMDEEAGLILELVENMDIRSLLKADSRVGLSNLLCISADICSALCYLESINIIHGHLTPGNVLIDGKMRAKLGSPRGQSHHAQLRYSSPESILLNQWTNKSDMWAYAVTTWEILQFCTRIPYEGLNNGDLIENAERMLAGNENSFVLLWPEVVPGVFRDSLSDSLRADPMRRPNFSQLLPVLSKFHDSLT